MKTIEGHDVKIFTDNIEENALEQIKELLSIDVFFIKKRHFLQVFVSHILIFRKLHLLLLSKMEVQAENGVKNH